MRKFFTSALLVSLSIACFAQGRPSGNNGGGISCITTPSSTLTEGVIYNLQGQKVAASSADLSNQKSGIYIVNGKKYLKK